ncbi:chemotaxis protein CheW [Haliea sp. E1-2-M8]|uniref:chemotaxis protein CheW n=1 Tax=Haliea sp. E1-2-M8 TaxID=3064706 RepID=UPI00271A0DD7|nr:chemotaxis protein CheW [Haliea sp. E1-2-M8]MDO8863575.1 chemotaxis protein CheW [Haliea sp. E1-2-M8]
MKGSHGSQFDWQSIRRRLDAALAYIDHETKVPVSEVNRILKARAQVLAQESTVSESDESLEILEFQLGHERYAVETCYVREVYQLDNLTTLPGVPPFVMGVVNIRGEIVSVVDIKHVLGLPEKSITHLNKVIVMELHSMVFGVLADEFEGVRRLPMSELDASRQGSTRIDGSYFRGITTSGLAILDGQVLLNAESIIVK